MIGLYSKSVTLNITIENDHPTVLLQDTVWRFNNKEIIEDGVSYSFLNDKKSLTIHNLNLSHEGVYSVTASNPAGYNSTNIQLDVQGTEQIYYIYGHNIIVLFCYSVSNNCGGSLQSSYFTRR